MVAQKLNELGFGQIVGYTNFDLHKFILEQPDLDLIMNIEKKNLVLTLSTKIILLLST